MPHAKLRVKIEKLRHTLPGTERERSRCINLLQEIAKSIHPGFCSEDAKPKCATRADVERLSLAELRKGKDEAAQVESTTGREHMRPAHDKPQAVRKTSRCKTACKSNKTPRDAKLEITGKEPGLLEIECSSKEGPSRTKSSKNSSKSQQTLPQTGGIKANRQ